MVTTAKSILYGRLNTEPVAIVLPPDGPGVEGTRTGVPGLEAAGVGGLMLSAVADADKRVESRAATFRGAGAAIPIELDF